MLTRNYFIYFFRMSNLSDSQNISDHARVRSDPEDEASTSILEELVMPVRRKRANPASHEVIELKDDGGDEAGPSRQAEANVGAERDEPEAAEAEASGAIVPEEVPQEVPPTAAEAAALLAEAAGAAGRGGDEVLRDPDNWFSSENYVSKIRAWDLLSLQERFQLSDTIKMRIMQKEERSNRPPRTLTAFSGALMRAGARVPLHPFIRGAVASFGLAPAQLNPNAYRIMCCAHILYKRMKESDLTVKEFRYFYTCRSSPGEQGLYFLVRWPEDREALIGHVPTSCSGWKDRNFWLGGEYDPESKKPGVSALPRNFRRLGSSRCLEIR
jgi:hypothetical protein